MNINAIFIVSTLDQAKARMIEQSTEFSSRAIYIYVPKLMQSPSQMCNRVIFLYEICLYLIQIYRSVKYRILILYCYESRLVSYRFLKLSISVISKTIVSLNKLFLKILISLFV